jgi:Spy/CpxP family protein refolding chaperone
MAKRLIVAGSLAALVGLASVTALSAQRPGQGSGVGPRPGAVVGQQMNGRGFGPAFARGGGPGMRRGGPARLFRGLDLTEAQRDKLKALAAEHRAATLAVLTPEQRAKLEARRNGRGGGERK